MKKLVHKIYEIDVCDFITYDGKNEDDVIKFTNKKMICKIGDSILIDYSDQHTSGVMRIHPYDFVIKNRNGEINAMSANHTLDNYKIIEV